MPHAGSLLLAGLLICVQAHAEATKTEATRTLRIDIQHTGNAQSEFISVNRIVREALPWPGNPLQPIDTTLRGKYLFEVLDEKSRKLLYSRSFSSIYGEWETTSEARDVLRSFSESLRLPEPSGEFRLIAKKRDNEHQFQTVWEQLFDPTDYLVHEETAAYAERVVPIENNGDPADKVDLLILGDGYTDAEHDKFVDRAKVLAHALLNTSPFRERRRDFNIWALAPPAAQSGISRPSTGIYRDSPLRVSYDAFRSERYVLTFDNDTLRRIASSAPYDFIEILTNTDTYGGGGIYGLYSTAAADNAWAEYLFIHEFGHHFAGLADEYYTSPVAYEVPQTIIEPYEPNVTALLQPEQLKWRHLVAASTPLPTPWPKQEYDTRAREYQAIRVQLRKDARPEAEMNALFKENQDFISKLFAKSTYRDRTGAFEGANYASRGVYRSAQNCVMFTRIESFCAVCSAAIEDVIDQYSRAAKQN